MFSLFDETLGNLSQITTRGDHGTFSKIAAGREPLVLISVHLNLPLSLAT